MDSVCPCGKVICLSARTATYVCGGIKERMGEDGSRSLRGMGSSAITFRRETAMEVQCLFVGVFFLGREGWPNLWTVTLSTLRLSPVTT